MALCLFFLPLPGRAESRSTRRLNTIADAYFHAQRRRQLRPSLSPRANSAWVRKLRGFERRLQRVKLSKLDSRSRITYRMLRRELKNGREYVTGGWMNQDLNGTDSLLHTVVAGTEAVGPSGVLLCNSRNVRDWRGIIRTLRNSGRFADTYINALEQGLQEGRGQPAPVVRSAIKSLDVLTSRDRRANPFLALEQQMTERLAGRREMPELGQKLRQVVRDNVIPSHEKLKKYLEEKYLPRAGRSGGNEARYLHHVAEHLGPDHPSPEALGKWGLREVEQLKRKMTRVMKTIDPRATSLEAFMRREMARRTNRFSTGREILAATQAEVNRAEGLARKMVPVVRSKVKAAPVPRYQESTTSAQYVLTGRRSGEIQVNTGPLLSSTPRFELATLATHEVFPGHHLAMMYALGNRRLPRYRRFSEITTYDEGWALYSEKWRNDHGGFTPHEQLGFFMDHLLRAARLVVDTGLHTGKMTRGQAASYLRKNAFLSGEAARGEVARYLDWPGQALAYYVGKRQILEMKAEAKKILQGGGWDERGFHARLLSLGSVPLDEAREAVLSWARRRAGQLHFPRR